LIKTNSSPIYSTWPAFEVCEAGAPRYRRFSLRHKPRQKTNVTMALHRDIFWVGRQWAVTGYGIQAVDQKLKGQFDIDASRLWEDGLLESLRAERWLNPADFEKALAVARKHHPEPQRKAEPPGQGVAGLIETVLSETSLKAKQTSVPKPEPAPQKFDMHFESCPAKFVRQWRVRITL
jgi:hypothetical protein